MGGDDVDRSVARFDVEFSRVAEETRAHAKEKIEKERKWITIPKVR